jgi:hypothetical protein
VPRREAAAIDDLGKMVEIVQVQHSRPSFF